MEIRHYQESDYGKVLALHNIALLDAGAHAGIGLWDDDIHIIRDVYLNKESGFLVGTQSGIIVAMGALQTLNRILRPVVSDFRGPGISVLRPVQSSISPPPSSARM